MKQNFSYLRIIGGIILGLNILIGCKDDAGGATNGHKPDSPVEITDFSPKEGSARTRMYIYGKNFGNDVSQITVKIGGKLAKVVGSNGEIIYCIVPFRAVEGTVEVMVGADSAYAKASENFNYQKKTMVSTLCGYVDGTGKTEVKDGKFDDCGFVGPMVLCIDPKNKNHIYLLDDWVSIRMMDIERDSVLTIMQKGQGNWSNLRDLNFTVGGDTMLVANDKTDDHAVAVSMMSRANNFRKPQTVAYKKRNICCAVHPINGEVYYCARQTGELWKYDWNSRQEEFLYTVRNKDCYFFIYFHPSGDFAYMCVPSIKVIMKVEYDWKNKKLKNPNVFCGKEGTQGYADGQGVNALLGQPYEGCFVKNEQYVNEGREDVYDFYFCDQYNHAIRYLTPDGFVYTYAGRGSKGVDSKANGYVDGDLRQEARFNEPTGICYDEENKIFYIADYRNKRVRTIIIDE